MHKMRLTTTGVTGMAGCSTARPDDTRAIQDQPPGRADLVDIHMCQHGSSLIVRRLIRQLVQLNIRGFRYDLQIDRGSNVVHVEHTFGWSPSLALQRSATATVVPACAPRQPAEPTMPARPKRECISCGRRLAPIGYPPNAPPTMDVNCTKGPPVQSYRHSLAAGRDANMRR